MNEAKLRGLMGLCVRARQAVFGEDGCLKAVRSGECAVLLLDEGASGATAEKYAGACGHAEVPLYRLPPGLIGKATGKPGVAMAVTDGGLAGQIRLLLAGQGQQTNSGNNCGGASVE